MKDRFTEVNKYESVNKIIFKKNVLLMAIPK